MSNKKTDFWYYTRNERQAVIILLVLVLVLFLLPAVYRFQPKEQKPLETSLFQREIERFESARADSATQRIAKKLFYFNPNSATKEELTALGLPVSTANTIIRYRQKGGSFKRAEELQKIYNLSTEDYQRLHPFIRIGPAAAAHKQAKAPEERPQAALFPFNPNEAGLSELLQLGLSEKVAGTLIKYREKGGRFRSSSELRKIYGLSDRLFERLEPYVRIIPSATASENQDSLIMAAKTTAQRAVPTSYESTPPTLVDINQASAEHWQQLYGIGPVLSGRIVKFRDKLGGFISIDQVAETYGLPDSTFQNIRSQLRFSPLPRLIAINKIPSEKLKDHPYIKWQQANVIVAYRREHGPFKGLEDLRKVRALNEEFLERIAPYLQYD